MKKLSIDLYPFKDIDDIYLVQNNCILYSAGHCSLHELNKAFKFEKIRFQECILLQIFQQLLLQLVYMKNNKILHGDIKPDNICIEYDFKHLINRFKIFLIYFCSEGDPLDYPGRCAEFYRDQNFERIKIRTNFQQDDIYNSEIISVGFTIMELMHEQMIKEIQITRFLFLNKENGKFEYSNIDFAFEFLEQETVQQQYPVLSVILTNIMSLQYQDPSLVLKDLKNVCVQKIKQEMKLETKEKYESVLQIQQQNWIIEQKDMKEFHNKNDKILEEENQTARKEFYLIKDSVIKIQRWKHEIYLKRQQNLDFQIERINFCRRAGLFETLIQLINYVPQYNLKQMLIFNPDCGKNLKQQQFVNEELLYSYIYAWYKVSENNVYHFFNLQKEKENVKEIQKIMMEKSELDTEQKNLLEKEFKFSEKEVCQQFIIYYFHWLDLSRKGSTDMEIESCRSDLKVEQNRELFKKFNNFSGNLKNYVKEIWYLIAINLQYHDGQLARIYSDTWFLVAKRNQIEKNQKETIKIIEEKIKMMHQQNLIENNIRHAQLIDMLAQSLLHQSQIRESLSHVYQSIDVRKRNCEIFDCEMGYTIGLLANVYYKLSNTNLCLNYMKMQKQVYLHSIGPLHPDVAANISNLAFLFTVSKKYQEALNYQYQAIEIRRKCFGEIHNEVGVSYHNIGSLLMRQQKYEYAQGFFVKCWDIHERLYGKDSQSSIALVCQYDMGQVESCLRNFKTALDFYHNVLRIRKQIFVDHYFPDINMTLDSIGLIYMKNGEIQKAMSYQKMALKQWLEYRNNKESQQYAVSLNNLAQSYKRQREVVKGYFLCRVSYDLLTTYTGQKSVLTANCAQNLCYFKQEIRAVMKQNNSEKNIFQNFVEQIGEELKYWINLNNEDKEEYQNIYSQFKKGVSSKEYQDQFLYYFKNDIDNPSQEIKYRLFMGYNSSELQKTIVQYLTFVNSSIKEEIMETEKEFYNKIEEESENEKEQQVQEQIQTEKQE